MNGSDISDGERGSSPVEPRDDATSKKLSLRGIGKFVADLAANGISSSTPDAPSEDALDSDVRESAARSFDLKIQEAEEFADRPESVEDLLDAAKNWTRRFSRKLNSDSLASLTTIFRMTNSSISGEYKGLSKQTLACMIGALLYCVSPIDVVPDAIPVVGLLDDAFVLSLAVKRLADELTTFRSWERLKTAKSALASYLPYFSDVKRVVLVPGWLTENDDCEAEIDVLAPIFPNAEFERFPWKSNVSWSEARDWVDGAGTGELEEFLRSSGELGTLALVGHSLGARLAVRVLTRLANEPIKKSLWSRKPLNRVAQAFLLGAAIDVDDPDLAKAPEGVVAPLCNFYSRYDRVLHYLYRFVEQKTPLGLTGLADPCRNYVDCVVAGREEYWLDLTRNVASIANFFNSGRVLQSLSIADCVSGDLAEYFRHQFKLYARFFHDSVVGNGDESTAPRDNSGESELDA